MRSKIAFHVLVRSARNRQSFGPSVTISPALKGPPVSISTRGPSENLLVNMSRKVSAAITPIDISMSCMMFFIEFSVCRELELQAINGLNEARNLAFSVEMLIGQSKKRLLIAAICSTLDSGNMFT